MVGSVSGIAQRGNPVARGPSFPKALLDAAHTQRQAHLDASGNPSLTTLYDGRELDLGATTKQSIPPRSFGPFARLMRERPDAGNALIMPDNATIATLRYNYGTDKSMEAWVTERPPNGKLVLNLLISPSIHAGSSNEEKLKNYQAFGKQNVYNLEIQYPDGTSELMKFDVDGNKDPKAGYEAKFHQAASLSPDVEIDMDKWKGQDVKIRGWADGSAGVRGYRERRETILHL